jgi:predicted RNA-binding Zn ribbon-like protein
MSMERSLAAPVRVAAPPDDLCLRFANTRYWRGSAEPTEDLRSPADLLAWTARECGLPANLLQHLAAVWQAGAGDAALTEALRLREAIFATFSGLAAGGDVPPSALAILNAALAEAPPRLRFALSAQQRGWEVPGEPALSLVLAPVLWSAGDLALGPREGRVRQCANPACQWLFLDDSKSGNRRWCSMSACGNRAKAHRHYLRQKAERQAG